MKKILLVEDDTMIASGLCYAFENENYEVKHFKTVSETVACLNKTTFDLAILDMQLPDGCGFDISEKLKSTVTPVIFLTVANDEEKIVKAFNEGAADYVVKPFRLKELLARVKRTLNPHNEMQVLSIGKANINMTSGKVYIDERVVALTALEYRLLLIFANNKSKLLTRTQILEHIWDLSGNFVEDNTLTVYIKRLREKLGDAVKIETVRGLGYRAD